MTTKGGYLYSEDKLVGSIADDRYSNLNLKNQKHDGCLFEEIFRPKNVESVSKKFQDYHALSKLLDFSDSNNLQSKKHLNSWQKSSKSSDLLNADYDSERKEKLKKLKGVNNSTLSLHIAAYENTMEVDSNDSDDAEKGEALSLVKKWRTSNNFVNSAIIENQFEFPRQQKDRANRPSVMQFSASQRLNNPNETEANSQSKPPCDDAKPNGNNVLN
uniref:Uncharacterized protein n=1 Tax=Panagrolaimus sp. ES5 TaxID=591445 RepID=A0AC34FBY3_9BILA